MKKSETEKCGHTELNGVSVCICVCVYWCRSQIRAQRRCERSFSLKKRLQMLYMKRRRRNRGAWLGPGQCTENVFCLYEKCTGSLSIRLQRPVHLA